MPGKVLLISSVPNMVCTRLSMFLPNNLHIIDCKDRKLSETELVKSVVDIAPDLIVAYRCPYILPECVFGMAEYGAYNIHPSLLPSYRGLNPWKEIFANNEKVNGVTLHKMTGDVDDGEIIFQEKYTITPTDNVETARDKADVIAAELAIKLLSSAF